MATKTNTATAKQPVTFDDYLVQLVNSKPQGEVTLNEVVARNPKHGKYEIVSLLKQSAFGTFITGRRGRESRFVWGQPKPITANLTAPAATPRHRESKMGLQVSIGGVTKILPLTMELVGA